MTIAEKIAVYLEDIENPIGRITNIIIAAIVLISTGTFIAQTYPIDRQIKHNLEIIDGIIVVIFSIEYGLRFIASKNKLKYIFSFYSLVDLLVILPFIFSTVDISFLRIFRWFRILRLIRFIEFPGLFGRLTSDDRMIVTRILFTLFSIIFVYSGLIYQVEHPLNPEKFSTFTDAVYFAVVTMTTVGFGDVTPITTIGKLMTVLMILTGIALIPWQLGDLIKQLVKTAGQINITCNNCGLYSHDLDAKYCKKCGEKLPNQVN